MEMEWKCLDAGALKVLYETELKMLHEALLNGAAWNELKEKRWLLTQLSRHLYKEGRNNPAEHATRTFTAPFVDKEKGRQKGN